MGHPRRRETKEQGCNDNSGTHEDRDNTKRRSDGPPHVAQRSPAARRRTRVFLLPA
jgi:hypothetical protein